MFEILYKYKYSHGIEDFGVSSHDILSSMGPSNVGAFTMCPTQVHNESDSDDSDEDANIVQENSMQVAAEGDKNNTEWVDSAQDNNEYVELEDPYLDEF